MEAVALMVIEVEIFSRLMPSNSRRMSSMESMATPTFPTSPTAMGWSESMPICVDNKGNDGPSRHMRLKLASCGRAGDHREHHEEEAGYLQPQHVQGAENRGKECPQGS